MSIYLVQAIFGAEFEDLYIEAASPEAAIIAARKLTRFRSRFTRFAI